MSELFRPELNIQDLAIENPTENGPVLELTAEEWNNIGNELAANREAHKWVLVGEDLWRTKLLSPKHFAAWFKPEDITALRNELADPDSDTNRFFGYRGWCNLRNLAPEQPTELPEIQLARIIFGAKNAYEQMVARVHDSDKKSLYLSNGLKQVLVLRDLAPDEYAALNLTEEAFRRYIELFNEHQDQNVHWYYLAEITMSLKMLQPSLTHEVRLKPRTLIKMQESLNQSRFEEARNDSRFSWNGFLNDIYTATAATALSVTMKDGVISIVRKYVPSDEAQRGLPEQRKY